MTGRIIFCFDNPYITVTGQFGSDTSPGDPGPNNQHIAIESVSLAHKPKPMPRAAQPRNRLSI